MWIRALLLSFLIFPGLSFGEGRVAIFDYDYRDFDEPGFAPYLEKKLSKWDPTLTIVTLSAEGDQQQGIMLLDQLDNEKWDLIITITTDALHLALHRLHKTPFVFTNAGNPSALGITDMGDINRTFTGASYYVSARKQLEFFLQIQPEIQRLGFLFDPNNRSMLVEAQDVRQACKELGIEFIYRRVATEASLALMASELVAEGVDAIVATNSDRIYLRISEIEKGLGAHQVPIYSFSFLGVEKGALAALASDHWEIIDKLVIPRVQLILRGHKLPSELAIGYLPSPQRYFNDEALKRFGFQRPEP